MKRACAYLIGACCLLAALAPAAGCTKERKLAAAQPPSVVCARPERGDVPLYMEFTGTIAPLEFVELRPRVDGYLEEVLFEPGALVEKGQPLFTIDPRPYLARLNEAKGRLAIRRAELKAATATLNRKQRALRDRAVSEVEVIEAQAAVETAQAGIEAAQAAVDTETLQLSYTHVRSPLAGRVGRSEKDPGNLVQAGTTLLSTVVCDDPFHVYFQVNERDLLRARSLAGGMRGRPLRLGLLEQKDHPYEGVIDFVDTTLDADSGTIRMRGVFRNPEHEAVAGMFARVRVAVGLLRDALQVPERAVGRDQQGRYVLVVGEGDVVRHRVVEAGPAGPAGRVIVAGLDAGDRVVVDGVQMAQPGRTVRPVAAANATAGRPAGAGN
ncbi:MAG: efflux RND transporter periplasmic adaptor subunit [Desulfovibrionaceae bacterium]|jgi:RND family efflux transporter MFP subunit|nr:efflux RND transporter periplasmic adaptor subunit [Desulfovibrionaceae bacterium]